MTLYTDLLPPRALLRAAVALVAVVERLTTLPSAPHL
jgi:hypothetical protein